MRIVVSSTVSAKKLAGVGLGGVAAAGRLDQVAPRYTRAAMRENERVAIALNGVSKSYGGVAAVDDITLEIGEGEFFSLLGPSGCGKTTTLRMIAGFVEPDAGSVVLQGADVTSVSANKRPVNMVFQQYALFPHMSIYDNVAFGLKVKRVPRGEHAQRIRELLRVVSLEGLENRRPRQLSGGQQQRVALARALVNYPAALLLDEPLGALDVKLRKQMQLELKRIQHELGTTFVYVTHDQEEALAMSDRIAVMNGGKVEQIGSPREIYEHPSTAFVADFIGSLNALDLTVDELVGACAVVRFGEGERVVVPVGSETRTGDSFRVAVRPERVQIGSVESPGLDGGSRLEGTIAQVVYLGMYTQFHVETKAGRVVSHHLADDSVESFEPGLAGGAVLGAGAHVGDRRRRADRRALELVLDLAEPPLADATSDLGDDDDRKRDGDHDDGDGDHLRQLAGEAQRRVEVDRERHARADDERRDRVLVERRRERDQECGDDRRQDQRQRHRAERPQPARAEVVGRLLERDVDLLQPRQHDEDRVRDADDDVADHHGEDRPRDARADGTAAAARSRTRRRGSRAGSAAAPTPRTCRGTAAGRARSRRARRAPRLRGWRASR